MSLGLSMKLLTMVYLLGHCPWTFKPLSQKKEAPECLWTLSRAF